MASKRDREYVEERLSVKRVKWNLWPFGRGRESERVLRPRTLAETIKSSNVGKFQAALKPILKDLGLASQKELPKIVFCGQESSGKSSTVERAANLPFTPRSQNICTRQPLYLECKHLEEDGPADSLVLETAAGRQNIPIDALEGGALEGKVKECMFSGPGIEELPIKMIFSSRKVPTMSFCDLPGTIGVAKTGEPLDMKERTVDLLKETISDPHALIVSVVTQDVRNNIALETLQKTPGALQRTIVVLAKADMIVDGNYKNRGKAGPYWMLKDMLTCNPIQGYAGKIYPVVNRDTTSRSTLTLAEVNANEQLWFEKNLPAYDRESQCSIKSVINAIDNMYSRHMREAWLPDVIATISEKKSMVEKDIRDLGIAPQSIDRVSMYSWFSNALREKLMRVVNSYYSMPSGEESETALILKECIGSSEEVNISPQCDMFKIAKNRMDMFARIRKCIGEAAQIHSRRYERALISTFEEKNYEYNMIRFTNLRRRCVQKLKLVLKKAVKLYMADMLSFSEMYEQSRISHPQLCIAEMYGAELHISVRNFAIPVQTWLLDGPSLRHEIVAGDCLVENCGSERKTFHDRITAFDKATSQLIVLRSI